MKLIKKYLNAGQITYSNENNTEVPYYTRSHWYGNLVSGMNGSRWSVHPGVYNFYTEDDGTIKWGDKVGNIVKERDGKTYVDFSVEDTSRPNLKTYQRFELGQTVARPKPPVVKEESEPIVKEEVKSNLNTNVSKTSTKQSIQKPKTVSKNSTSVVHPIRPKQNVPLLLVKYVGKIDNNGNIFFKIPDGINEENFEAALKKVLNENQELAKKEIPLYNNISQQTLTKSSTNNTTLNTTSTNNTILNTTLNITLNTKKVTTSNKDNASQGNLEQTRVNRNLLMYVYPHKNVNLYNIHPDVYTQVLKELQNKTNTNDDLYKDYLFSPTKLKKVYPGQLLNDSVFYYYGNADKPAINFVSPIINKKLTSPGEYLTSWSYTDFHGILDGKNTAIVKTIQPSSKDEFPDLRTGYDASCDKYFITLPAINKSGLFLKAKSNKNIDDEYIDNEEDSINWFMTNYGLNYDLAKSYVEQGRRYRNYLECDYSVPNTTVIDLYNKKSSSKKLGGKLINRIK